MAILIFGPTDDKGDHADFSEEELEKIKGILRPNK
jgi:hypothetical protein